MPETRPDPVAPATSATPATAAQRQQILLYAPSGLLGGMFTCSRCHASGHHPDVIGHDPGCSYRPGGDDVAPAVP